MPFEIVRNDIVNMRVDAIVNTANPLPVIGAGTDARIHQAAGAELLEARQRIGDIAVGHAAATPAFQLPAKYVLHTVGPLWRGGDCGEEAQLRSCYDSCLRLALELGCGSVAFPLISTGNYGFPKDRALQIAIAAFTEFLTGQEMEIRLVVFDSRSFRLTEKLFQKVESFIDENYVKDTAFAFSARCREDAAFSALKRSGKGKRAAARKAEPAEDCCSSEFMPASPAPAEAKAVSLDNWLEQMDAGFTETLLKLIEQTGRKDAEIYRKANLSKQHFSKIRSNPNYKPTKPTAIALALALELDLEATKDLLGRAGYALTNSSKFDLIIRYFIENRNYNIVEINCVLFEHDQSLLGAQG